MVRRVFSFGALAMLFVLGLIVGSLGTAAAFALFAHQRPADAADAPASGPFRPLADAGELTVYPPVDHADLLAEQDAAPLRNSVSI